MSVPAFISSANHKISPEDESEPYAELELLLNLSDDDQSLYHPHQFISAPQWLDSVALALATHRDQYGFKVVVFVISQYHFQDDTPMVARAPHQVAELVTIVKFPHDRVILAFLSAGFKVAYVFAILFC